MGTLNQEKNLNNLSLILLQLSLMKKIKVEPISSTFKNGIMFYCNELPFLIKHPNCFINIETMDIISYDDEDEITLFEIACKECWKTPKNDISLAIKLLEQNRWNYNILQWM